MNYNGTISSLTANHLEVSLPYGSAYEFGARPITIQTEFGQRYDVREAITEGEIAPGVGKIALVDVPAGANGDYATATVHFNKTADLNNDGTVDPVDLALITGNWLNEEGVTAASAGYLLGDIAGANGSKLPDGIVDLNDFNELASQYGS